MGHPFSIRLLPGRLSLLLKNKPIHNNVYVLKVTIHTNKIHNLTFLCILHHTHTNEVERKSGPLLYQKDKLEKSTDRPGDTGVSGEAGFVGPESSFLDSQIVTLLQIWNSGRRRERSGKRTSPLHYLPHLHPTPTFLAGWNTPVIFKLPHPGVSPVWLVPRRPF